MAGDNSAEATETTEATFQIDRDRLYVRVFT